MGILLAVGAIAPIAPMESAPMPTTIGAPLPPKLENPKFKFKMEANRNRYLKGLCIDGLQQLTDAITAI